MPGRVDQSGPSDGTPETAAALKRQIDRVSLSLQSAAHGLYADKMKSIGAFDVFIADSADAQTRSSASGKIALYRGIATLTPSDEWLAFAIAREMGHVLAGHHEDNSAASLITSVIMNILIPSSGLIKSALSLAGSQAASAAGAERQMREADEIALRLLETSGYRMRELAHSLASGPSDEKLGAGSWAQAFRDSAAAIVNLARTTVAPIAQTLGAGVLFAGPSAAAPRVPASPANPATLTALATVPALAPAPVLPAADAASTEPSPARLEPASTAAAAAVALTVATVATPNFELPAIRTRPSGVAGPLMLGGHFVPARRID